MNRELYDKGLAVRREVVGERAVEKILESARRIQHADAGAADRILLGFGVDSAGPRIAAAVAS